MIDLQQLEDNLEDITQKVDAPNQEGTALPKAPPLPVQVTA